MVIVEQYYIHPIITLLLAFVSFLAITLLVLCYRHISQFAGNNLPLGHGGYPVIGESYDFVSNGWKGHPEKFILDRVNKYSSQVFKTSFIGERTVFFCSNLSNKFLFSNDNKLVKVWFPSCVDKIFPSSSSTSSETSAAEEAAKMRKMLPNFIKLDALQRYFGIIDQCTRSHIADHWTTQGVISPFNLN